MEPHQAEDPIPQQPPPPPLRKSPGLAGWWRGLTRKTKALLLVGAVLALGFVGQSVQNPNSPEPDHPDDPGWQDEPWMLVPKGKEIMKRFAAVSDANLAEFAATKKAESDRIHREVILRAEEHGNDGLYGDREFNTLVSERQDAYAAYADAIVESAQRVNRRVRIMSEDTLARELHVLGIENHETSAFADLRLPKEDVKRVIESESARRRQLNK